MGTATIGLDTAVNMTTQVTLSASATGSFTETFSLGDHDCIVNGGCQTLGALGVAFIDFTFGIHAAGSVNASRASSFDRAISGLDFTWELITDAGNIASGGDGRAPGAATPAGPADGGCWRIWRRVTGVWRLQGPLWRIGSRRGCRRHHTGRPSPALPGDRMMSGTRSTLALAVATLLLAGCSTLAISTAPAKPASTQRSELAKQADALFWQVLHGGRYQDIGRALEVHTAAYLQDPGDALTAAHTGWLHIWRLAESSRLAQVPATITDDAVLARKYFEEAVRLQPGEARFQGFLGSALLAEGAIHKDEKLTRQGYYTLLDSIDAWPEFNLFTAGYSLSRLPAESARFKQALEMQWRTLDLCVGQPVSRQNPDFRPYMGQATETGTKRVCWNSWIAPHNFEGFFLNMGDMLVKSGDVATAVKVYANARHSPTYDSWPQRALLEQRITDAPRNGAAFTAPGRPQGPDSQRMLINSSVACMACHQR